MIDHAVRAGAHFAFTDRWGGVSTSPYGELNLGGAVGDDPEAVRKNREIAARELGLNPADVVWMNQVHGAEVAVVTERQPLGGAPTVDAVVTDRPLALAVLTADGTLISLELDPRHAEVARGNLARAGLGEVAEVRVGRAADSLAALVEQGEEPFDLVFIDADKPSNPEYFRRALQLTGPGSLIIVDNVVRGGAIADAASTDPAIVGTRTLHELIAAEPRVTGTSVQTVGSKGYDGFTLVRVQG